MLGRTQLARCKRTPHPMSKRIAYFINQYPTVSHSFIRREILALERQGLEVLRIAARGWDGELVDAGDLQERTRTHYVLEGGVFALIQATLRVMLTRPIRFAIAFKLAARMGRRAERSLAYHFAYLAEACRMLPWLQSFGATHVHAHFGTNSTEVAMLVHALGGPSYSFTVHGPDEFDNPQFIGLGEKIRRSSFVVAISSFARSQLYRWVEHAYWAKVHVVHCGLEPAFHDVEPVQPTTRPRFVCVGRLQERKGQVLLVEAASRLAARGIEFELILAGDGEMRAEIEALIQTLGLSQSVKITGWISSERVRTEILAARCLVLPSFAEGLPVVVMEAMALRRPVITTYVAGIPELVQPGENGWLVAAGSIDDLAGAMEDCLNCTPEELTRMGGAAHRRVIERHSIDVEAKRLITLFDQFCATPRSS